MKSGKHLLIFGSVLGGLAVILGAFGAHGLKEVLSPERLQTFETAVRYQFYHALALLICGILAKMESEKGYVRAGNLFLAGIILFSGSLYLLIALNQTILGAITPFGGVAFIAGWIFLLIAAIKGR